MPRTTATGLDSLSPRELEVLRLYAQGLPKKTVGHRLDGIHERTVEYHLNNINRKLGVGTIRQSLVMAARAGVV